MAAAELALNRELGHLIGEPDDALKLMRGAAQAIACATSPTWNWSPLVYEQFKASRRNAA